MITSQLTSLVQCFSQQGSYWIARKFAIKRASCPDVRVGKLCPVCDGVFMNKWLMNLIWSKVNGAKIISSNRTRWMCKSKCTDTLGPLVPLTFDHISFMSSLIDENTLTKQTYAWASIQIVGWSARKNECEVQRSRRWLKVIGYHCLPSTC